MSTELLEKFMARVEKTDTCWQWTGSISVYGYGQFQPTRAKSYRAHRLAYELLVGPIPDGLVLDHLCRNRACVNPEHLEPVTSRTNILRGVGPTAVNAHLSTCPKGHPFDSVGTKGERRCSTCDNAKTTEWSRRKRQSIECGAANREGKRCQRRIALGKSCIHHGTANVGGAE